MIERRNKGGVEREVGKNRLRVETVRMDGRDRGRRQVEKKRNRAQHTRSRQWNFVVPDVKGIERNTFYFNAVNYWNSLPNKLKSCEDLCSFKKE